MNVAVIGLGLIGGSVARGLSEIGLAACVYGFDLDESVVDLALERDVIQGRLDPARHGGEVDLWILAVPPFSVPEWLARVNDHRSEAAAVTDVTSVKAFVHAAVPDSMRSAFVGGHPMAGRRERGLEASRPDLFCDQPWILCPGEASSEAIKRVERMVYALEAHPFTMTPEAHDAHVAWVSHLPNVVANALLHGANSDAIVAGSWRDTTRVAGTNPALWAQIALANRDEVRNAIANLRSRLDQFDAALNDEDLAALRRLFGENNA